MISRVKTSELFNSILCQNTSKQHAIVDEILPNNNKYYTFLVWGAKSHQNVVRGWNAEQMMVLLDMKSDDLVLACPHGSYKMSSRPVVLKLGRGDPQGSLSEFHGVPS